MFFCFKTKYNYDKNDNIATKQHILNDITHNIENTYDNNDNIIKKVIDNNEVNYTYDYLGRITNRNINNNYNTDYTYITNGKRTSLLVKTLKNNNDIYKYKYDKLNNITHIYLNDNLINRYYYDNYNELIKEHDYQNNQTIEYTYDNYGNLLSKKIYELNTTTLVNENTYEYSNTNWVDQLTKFNNESITYDEIGNPLTISNKTLTWINGRQLNSYNDGTNNINFTYNKDGIRKSKTINNVTTNYYVEGNDIVFEETNNNVIYYIRDISGLTGFEYSDNIYYYVKNLQNDIIGILDSNYQEIAKYKYDSWGNILSIIDNNGNDISNDPTHIANINPYRYRSYYYDKETDLYYLNSRYYNPKWGRFLNTDKGISNVGEDIKGYNLFTYCFNNPINMDDNNGEWPKWATKLVIAVAIVAVVTTVAAVTIATAGAGSAAAIITMGAVKGAAIGLISGAAIGASSAAINHRVSTGSWNNAEEKIIEETSNGALTGTITGLFIGAANSTLNVIQAAKSWSNGTFKSGYKSMKYHYEKHVIKEGLVKGNNVIKYTQDATAFANQNFSLLKYTYNYKYGNASWNLTYSTGKGGMFASNGKIITFWYK